MEKETLEEASWKVLGTKDDTFYNGAKWQAERMYSEQEVMDMFDKFSMHLPLHYEFLVKEMFKKK